MSFAVVKFNETDAELYVNLRSRARSIYDFLEATYAVPAEKRLDLCDKNGKLVNLGNEPDGSYGYEFLEEDLYFVVFLEVEGDQYGSVEIGSMRNKAEVLAGILKQTRQVEKTKSMAANSKRKSFIR